MHFNSIKFTKDLSLLTSGKPALVIFSLAMVLLILSTLRFIGAGNDDTWISLFVSKYLGQGPWFLNSNFVPQEMSTSILAPIYGKLWLLIAPEQWMYLVWKLGMFIPAIISVGLLAWRLKMQEGIIWSLVFLLILAAMPQWAYWTWGGMENGLYSLTLLFMLLSLAHCYRNPSTTALLLYAGALFLFNTVRADALWSFCLPIALFVSSRFKISKEIWLGWSIGLGLFILLLLTRHHFTGVYFPNPAYAKAKLELVTAQHGLAYFWDFHTKSIGHFVFLVLTYAVAIYVSFSFIIRERRADFLFLFLATLSFIAIDALTILTGGDWMPMHRFIARTLDYKIFVLVSCAILFWNFSPKIIWRSTIILGFLALIGLCPFIPRTIYFSWEDKYIISTAKTLSFSEWYNNPKKSMLRSNAPLYRDSQTLRKFMLHMLPQLIKARTNLGHKKPFVFASHQAGYFPYQLRKTYGPDEILFLDLFGLSDYRIGSLDHPKSPFGLSDGQSGFHLTIGAKQGALGEKLKTCEPDFVYVFNAPKDRREALIAAGYKLVFKNPAALIFESDPARMLNKEGCQALLGPIFSQ